MAAHGSMVAEAAAAAARADAKTAAKAARAAAATAVAKRDAAAAAGSAAAAGGSCVKCAGPLLRYAAGHPAWSAVGELGDDWECDGCGEEAGACLGACSCSDHSVWWGWWSSRCALFSLLAARYFLHKCCLHDAPSIVIAKAPGAGSNAKVVNSPPSNLSTC